MSIEQEIRLEDLRSMFKIVKSWDVLNSTPEGTAPFDDKEIYEGHLIYQLYSAICDLGKFYKEN